MFQDIVIIGFNDPLDTVSVILEMIFSAWDEKLVFRTNITTQKT